nr:uncharacterized protein LOC117690818 [Crassostrea gigas]
MDSSRFILLVAVWQIMDLQFTASQVCIETETKVSKCPSNASERKKRASEKCSKACGNPEYEYHCMIVSTHEELVEMCAKPKALFSYCPMYDRVGHQIQSDLTRHCNINAFYYSFNMAKCGVSKCLKLHASSGTTSETTLNRTRTEINGTTIETTTIRTSENDGENGDHLTWIILVIVIVFITTTSILLIFLYNKKCQSKESSNSLQNLTPDCWKLPTKGIKKNEQIEDSVNRQELLSETGDNVAITV